MAKNSSKITVNDIIKCVLLLNVCNADPKFNDIYMKMCSVLKLPRFCLPYMMDSYPYPYYTLQLPAPAVPVSIAQFPPIVNPTPPAPIFTIPTVFTTNRPPAPSGPPPGAVRCPPSPPICPPAALSMPVIDPRQGLPLFNGCPCIDPRTLMPGGPGGPAGPAASGPIPGAGGAPPPGVPMAGAPPPAPAQIRPARFLDSSVDIFSRQSRAAFEPSKTKE